LKETRKQIDENWNIITSQNARTYNKSKFRLDDFVFDDATKTVVLHVGLTDYKDLQGTNLVDSRLELVDNSKIGGKRFKKLSQAIGVGGWVITKDRKFFLIQNALWKGEQGGKFDRPGGHPEPQDATLETGIDEETKLTNIQVRKEIFASEQKEIRDEINIPIQHQSEPELIGIVYNLDMGGRVGLEFKIEVDLTSQQIIQLYRTGDQPEADETTDVVFFDLSDCNDLDASVYSRLTPHARGSLRFLAQISKN